MNSVHRKTGRLSEPSVPDFGPRGVVFSMPLGEIVFDFYDKLKAFLVATPLLTTSRMNTKPSEVGQVGHLINGDQVDALSALGAPDQCL